MRIGFSAMGAALMLAALAGCKIRTENKVEVAPIEVKPVEIKLTIDVNVRVDRELDNFFGDLDNQ